MDEENLDFPDSEKLSSMQVKCSIGSFLQLDCNKLSYTSSTCITSINHEHFTEEEMELLVWRSGIVLNERSNICSHHKEVFLTRYEQQTRACYDPFKAHKGVIKKNLRIISLQFAKSIQANLNLNITPGLKLCCTCRKEMYDRIAKMKENRELEDNVSDNSPSYSLPSTSTKSNIESTSNKCEKNDLNISLGAIGVSPLKLHSIPTHSRTVIGKRKLKKAQAHLSSKISSVLKLPKRSKLNTESSDSDSQVTKSILQQKADDLDSMVQLMKNKIPEVNKREKIQILSFTPRSWSRETAAKYFGVSEHMVRQARLLTDSFGICTLPQAKQGRKINVAITSLVEHFYQDDEYSRQLSGSKDYVSIKQNVHVQKRLLLCNLSELYTVFKEKFPDQKIGFSKFCFLRPKWCVLAGSSGTHVVCVCAIHQNVQLLLHAVGLKKDAVNELIHLMVCEIDRRECMLGLCINCPQQKIDIRDQITRLIVDKEFFEDEEIKFTQWVSTDRSQLIDRVLPVPDFIDLLLHKLELLIPHSYVTKNQAKYFKSKKEHLPENETIILMDFSENYGFILQNEVQSYHWSHVSCTLHPVVIYYKSDSKLCNFSLCFLSDDLTHDVPFVYAVQKKTIDFIKNKCPRISKVEYFTDGCAAQYKNCKSMLNLCHHKDDFGMDAAWSFFATSHGKSPCDGIGGSVKRMVTKANLQRPSHDQISNPYKMYTYCKEHFSNVKFFFIPQDEVNMIRNNLTKRFSTAKTISGTRGFHHFFPVSDTTIAAKRISTDATFTLKYNFYKFQSESPVSINIHSFVSCIYDSNWYIGLVTDMDEQKNDINVKFMHPAGPAKSFYWPCRADTCWIPIQHVLCTIEVPTTISGRQYQLHDHCHALIHEKWNKFHNS